MKIYQYIGIAILSITVLAGVAWGHCQIPCGIYDDEARFSQMREHITTLEKSINQINELSQAGNLNHNQITRWIINKEEHADAMTEILTEYFLIQRIKHPVVVDAASDAKYLDELVLIHQMMVNLMKTKQNTDLQYTDKLTVLLDDFEKVYFE